jgi:hypothetical protein
MATGVKLRAGRKAARMQIWTWRVALLSMVVLGACSQEAPPEAPKAPAAAGGGEVAAPQATLAPQPTPDEEYDDVDAGPGMPTTETEMYGYQFEIMPYPPPLGPNGESRTFGAGSTSAFGVTGEYVTFSSIGEADYTFTHDVRMQGSNGLSCDLELVHDGGVDAISTIDWSKVMMQEVGMAEYLKFADETTDWPATLVFVFKVIGTGETGKPTDAPGCENDGYIAITAPTPGLGNSWDERGLTIATFSPGPWPPADSSSHSGTSHYFHVPEAQSD